MLLSQLSGSVLDMWFYLKLFLLQNKKTWKLLEISALVTIFLGESHRFDFMTIYSMIVKSNSSDCVNFPARTSEPPSFMNNESAAFRHDKLTVQVKWQSFLKKHVEKLKSPDYWAKWIKSLFFRICTQLMRCLAATMLTMMRLLSFKMPFWGGSYMVSIFWKPHK